MLSQDYDEHALYSREEKYTAAGPKFTNAIISGDVPSRASVMDSAQRVPDCVDPLLNQQCAEFRL